MLLSLLVLVHSLRPRRTLLSSACQFAGIYCPSKILVAAFVVMAGVIVVNVEFGMLCSSSVIDGRRFSVVACGYLG